MKLDLQFSITGAIALAFYFRYNSMEYVISTVLVLMTVILSLMSVQMVCQGKGPGPICLGVWQRGFGGGGGGTAGVGGAMKGRNTNREGLENALTWWWGC